MLVNAFGIDFSLPLSHSSQVLVRVFFSYRYGTSRRYGTVSSNVTIDLNLYLLSCQRLDSMVLGLSGTSQISFLLSRAGIGGRLRFAQAPHNETKKPSKRYHENGLAGIQTSRIIPA